jgi:O-antigen ligase
MSMIKLAGMVFFIASLLRPKVFYGLLPTPLLVLLVYSVAGPVIDLFKLPLNLQVLNTFIGPMLMWILMLATYNLAVRGRRNRIVLAILVSSLIFTVFQVFELGGVGIRILDEVHSGETDTRVSVLLVDPNFAACFMALSVAAGLMYLMNLVPARTSYRILAVPVIALGVYGMIKTSSRGGLAALVLGMLAIAATARTRLSRIVTILSVALLLCGLGALILASPLFSARLNDSLETGETADRTIIWGQAVRLFVESPIWGYGAQSYVIPLGERSNHPGIGTHNVFLSVALGAGLIGLSSFMFFYLSAFASIFAYRTRGVNAIVFVWFVMAFAAALSLNMEITKWFWIMLALACAAGKTSQRSGPSIRPPPVFNSQIGAPWENDPASNHCLPIKPN